MSANFISYRKDVKRCATCSFWGGTVRNVSGNNVSVDPDLCREAVCSKKKRTLKYDFGNSCSDWKQRY